MKTYFFSTSVQEDVQEGDLVITFFFNVWIDEIDPSVLWIESTKLILMISAILLYSQPLINDKSD